jgi:uncharacterized protein YndB with AHSA1/START domain
MSRHHETRVTVDAPLAEVWKAISEAPEIARWFAPKIDVEPGVGGFVLADWGPGLEWKTAIEIWEPERHLRLVETRDRVMTSAPVTQPLEACKLIQDYYLEGQGGQTVLRLVHSGFGSSADWDVEYEGTRWGWASCFLRLQHGLERHRGDSVHNSIVTAICEGVSWEESLARIEAAAPPEMQVLLREKYHLSGLLPDRNGSILTVSVQPFVSPQDLAPGGSVAYVELLLYGFSDDESSRFEQDWRSKAAALFASPRGAGSTR